MVQPNNTSVAAVFLRFQAWKILGNIDKKYNTTGRLENLYQWLSFVSISKTCSGSICCDGFLFLELSYELDSNCNFISVRSVFPSNM